jgi:hypothetical protein
VFIRTAPESDALSLDELMIPDRSRC